MPKYVSKRDMFKYFSKFGKIDCIISESEKHHLIGSPNKIFGMYLSNKYLNVKNVKDRKCFYVIFESKGGFKRCCIAASYIKWFHTYKMDKKICEYLRAIYKYSFENWK